MENNIKEIESTLWKAANKMIGGLTVSDYKYVVLGIIFLKYLSDSFEEKYKQLVEEGYGLETSKDAYMAENIFYVPEEARWGYIVENSKKDNIGEILDKALSAIEKENKSLKGVLFKVYNSPDFRNVNLGQIIDLFSNLKLSSDETSERDMLGRVYEYFLGEFAVKDGQKGGEFYTPSCIVKTLVEILEPFEGRIYDPCCGSGGMFVQSLKFIENHQGNSRQASVFGQEKNPKTWKLAKMNLAIRSISCNLGTHPADTFHEDLHKNLKADYILSNPPFNISDYDQEKLTGDYRFRYGMPPKGNANYAWIQHIISKLSKYGMAGVVLANGALSSGGQEATIREEIIKEDLIDCIIAMPSNLFYTVTIPCSLWIIKRGKKQEGHTLFINASELGTMVSRKLKELTEEDIKKIATTYHNYVKNENYEDIPGFCKKASLKEIEENGYVLAPGRYVGTKETEDNGISFDEKMKTLTEELSKQMKASQELDKELKKVLEALGYNI